MCCVEMHYWTELRANLERASERGIISGRVQIASESSFKVQFDTTPRHSHVQSTTKWSVLLITARPIARV